jgi:hypothetical protein
MRAAFTRGVARGEIAPGIDTELALDMLTAPYYFRALFGHARMTPKMSAKIVDLVLSAAGRDRAGS